MRKLGSLFVATLVMAVAVVPAAFAQGDAESPKLVVIEPVKDFGSMPKGDPLNWGFKIKNEGKADLIIDSVKPSCGCTVADFPKSLKPGEGGTITLKVETKNFEGPISKSATVTSNDPTTPTTTLFIKAIVKPFVSVLPQSYVRFASLEGEDATQQVTLVSEEKGAFKIEKIETTKPYVEASFLKLEKSERVEGRGEGDQYRIDIHLSPDAPVGLLNEKVTAHTNLEKAKTVEITVSGLVRPVVSVTPQKLNFGTVDAAGEPMTRNVIVANNREEMKDFKVTKVELVSGNAASLSGITTEISPIQDGARYQVVLKTADGIKKGPLAGTLKIHTNDKKHPVYEVDISGMVQ